MQTTAPQRRADREDSRGSGCSGDSRLSPPSSQLSLRTAPRGSMAQDLGLTLPHTRTGAQSSHQSAWLPAPTSSGSTLCKTHIPHWTVLLQGRKQHFLLQHCRGQASTSHCGARCR